MSVALRDLFVALTELIKELTTLTKMARRKLEEEDNQRRGR